MGGSTFLTRVVLRNYKSIGACDVRLGPLCFLVGPNGAGKSNFLDALRFVADALRTSLEHVFRDRGGINEVRRRSGGHPTHFGVRLEFSLPSGMTGFYAFQIGAKAPSGFEVQKEECRIHPSDPLAPETWFEVKDRTVRTSIGVAVPPAVPDRLYLVNAAGLPDFRPVYDALSRMGFYNLSPDRIREPQIPDPGELLARDGSNLASVLGRLGRDDPAVKERIIAYLGSVVPGVTDVDEKTLGPMETIEFRQRVAGARDPWRFPASGMSDGTLRALGILVALFQSRGREGLRVPLVGIEEPEIALHPAAAGVLLDALREASHQTQVVVTSHSPDLLDDAQLDSREILAVVADGGVTRIGSLDEAGRSALQDRLYTAGELLRLNQLAPETEDAAGPLETDLFGGVGR